MAGLLDIFGTSGQDTMGLLGMSPEDIARSRDDAQAQALYALAGRLFQGGRGASSVVEGLQQGQQAYKQAMQGGMQQQLQNYQLQELLKKKQLEEQQRKEELMARQLFMRGYQPAVAGKESMPIEEDGRFIGDSQAIAARPAKFDIGSIAPELMAIGPAGQAKLKTGLELQKSMAGETFKLGEGEKQYQRNALTGEITEVAAGAPKREPVPTSIAEYNLAKAQGFEGTFQDFEKSKKGFTYQDVGNAIIQLDATGKEVSRIPKGRAPEGPINFQTVETDQGLMAFNPRTLQMTPIMGADNKPITKTGKPTEGETNAAGFASRMVAANAITSKLATGNVPKTVEAISSAIPFIGKAIPEIIPEGIGGLSSDRRQYLQAANNFIRANLRKESGAAIGVDEWTAEFINYFPQYNDDAQTIKQKEIFRNILTQNMVAAGGKSYKAPSMTAPESMTDTYGLNPRLRDSLRGGR